MLSIEELIKKAQTMGVDFGRGDPYNRLRYYTKIGWLPHMTRQRDKDGNIRGHYPESVLSQLITIEKLKEAGASNDEIAKQIEIKSKYTNLINLIKSKEVRNQIISYSTLLLLLVIFANELGLVNLGQHKSSIIEAFSSASETPQTLEIMASGEGIVPKGRSSVFIKEEKVAPGAKIYVTFTQNFSPATAYWVTNVRPGEGFELKLDAPVYYNATFNWWTSR